MGMYPFFHVPVQVQCERFYIMPFKPCILVPVLETASVNKPLQERSYRTCIVLLMRVCRSVVMSLSFPLTAELSSSERTTTSCSLPSTCKNHKRTHVNVTLQTWGVHVECTVAFASSTFGSKSELRKGKRTLNFPRTQHKTMYIFEFIFTLQMQFNIVSKVTETTFGIHSDSFITEMSFAFTPMNRVDESLSSSQCRL